MTTLVAAALLVAACTPAKVQLASGIVSGSGWSAWTWVDGQEGVCVELRPSGRQETRLCGFHPGESPIWRPDAVDGEEGFLLGELGDARETRARVTLADGTVAEADGQVAPAVSALRFYVVVLPTGAVPARLDLLDASGSVVESRDIRV